MSVLLGLLVNVLELYILLELFGYYLLAYALMFVIDVVVMRVLKSSVITEDGNGIRHPRWFNFFMVVLSMVTPSFYVLFSEAFVGAFGNRYFVRVMESVVFDSHDSVRSQSTRCVFVHDWEVVR